MVRRSFWTLVGAFLGVWTVVKVQRAVSGLTATEAAEAAQRQARQFGDDLAAAVAEGRRVKQATELDLRRAASSRPAIGAGARPALPGGEPGAGAAEELRARR